MGNQNRTQSKPREINETFRQQLNEKKFSTSSETDEMFHTELNKIIDWANEEGLEVKDIYYGNPEDELVFWYDGHLITLYDSKSGKEIGLTQHSLKTLHDDSYGKEVYISKLHTLVEDIRELPPEFKGFQKTNTITIDGGSNAWFDKLPENKDKIFIGTEILLDNPKTCYNTGWKAIMIHEMTHLLDRNNNGDCGYDGFFSRTRKYQPTTYGDWRKSEVITTTVEMVYSGKLRDDAQLRNGDKPKSFKQWYDDWNHTKLIKRAEEILAGTYDP